MKQFLFMLIFISAFSFGKAQNTPGFGKISISIEDAKSTDGLSYAQLDKLKTKVLSVLSAYSISGYGQASNFQILPSFDVMSQSSYEGLKTQQLVTADLTLIIQQASTQTVYATQTIKLNGVGETREIAITNAISQIKSTNPEIQKFIADGKSKIISYYDSKCNDILKEVDKYFKMGEYDKAVVIAMNVPVEATGCYDKSKQKVIDVFNKNETATCKKILLWSDLLKAERQYGSALEILKTINVNSTCYSEAGKKIAGIEASMSQQEKLQWEHMKERDKIDAAWANTANAIFGGGESLFSLLLKEIF